jgi:hypothetical protein
VKFDVPLSLLKYIKKTKRERKELFAADFVFLSV